MTSRRIPFSNSGGFTLLEVMLAIFMFAIILTIVLTAFSQTMANVKAIQETSSAYEIAKNAMDRMITDLESVRVTMPPAFRKPQGPDDLDPWRITCEIKDVEGLSCPIFRFVSQAHVDFSGQGKTGAAEIIYYVTPDRGEEPGLVLRRRDTLDWELFGDEEELGSDPILCDKLQRIEFTFEDQDGDTQESWNSDSELVEFATPRAVGVALEIRGNAGEDSAPFLFETMVNLPIYRENVE